MESSFHSVGTLGTVDSNTAIDISLSSTKRQRIDSVTSHTDYTCTRNALFDILFNTKKAEPKGNGITTGISNGCNRPSCYRVPRYDKGRTPKALRSKRRNLALDKLAVSRDVEKQCGCDLGCNKKFTAEQILYWRRRIHSLSEGAERMNKIIEMLKICSLSIKKHERNRQFRVEGNLVCRKYFVKTLLGISESTISRAISHVISKRDEVVSERNTQFTHGARGRICEGFIQSYVNTACDRDPTGKVYRMPTCVTRMDLFHLYQTVHKSEAVQKSTFYDILDKKFDNVVFSKSQRFTKCKDCNNFRILIEKEKDPASKEQHIFMRDLHLREQQMEREAYYVRRAQAEMRVHEILSVIIDGMDQAKTNLPHYSFGNNPVGSGSEKLKTHITGCIVHGREKYFYLDFNQYPHDTNLTLSCLLHTLSSEAKDGCLPPTLYIQLDNTCRENKNRYFLGMMAYLVKMGFVKEVWMSFLVVGHTHEDVDQCFSRISSKLKPSNCRTIDELHSIIQSSQLPTPKSANIEKVWNISKWLEPYVQQVHNVTFPKLYRIFNDSTGHTTIQFKKLSTDDQWHPSPGEKPLEIFKLQNGLQVAPEGIPEVVAQQFDEDDMRCLQRSMEKDFQLAQFGEEEIQCWRNFFENPIMISDNSQWPLNNMTMCSETQNHSSLSDKEKQLLEAYKAKRQEFKMVHTSSKGGDRREYTVGNYIIYFTEKERGAVSVGKVNASGQYDITIQKCKVSGMKGITLLNDTVSIPMSECFPGAFKLTNQGHLPKQMKERVSGYKLE